MLINEPEVAQHARKIVEKLWGREYWIVNSDLYCLKFLKVNPGFQCSIHAHKLKDETFVGYSGTLQLNLHRANGELYQVFPIEPGYQRHILPGTYHSFIAVNVCFVMEVSTFHSDADVVRIQESRKLDVE